MPSSSIQPPTPLSFSGDLAANWKHFHQVWTNYVIITGLEKQTEEYRVALFLHCISSEALKTFNGNLAKTCNFGSLHDSLVRDRIVFGIQSKHMRQKLLQEHKLTLKKCIDICRSNEATSSQMKEIASGSNLEAVNKVEDPTHNTTRVTKTCHFCGNKHKMNKKKCPACGKQCQKCNGRNHFASVYIDSDVEFITSICLEEEYISQVSDNEYPKEIYAEMIINGSSLSFQVDCGASVNILPLKYVGDCAIKPSKKSLCMWNGTNITPVGSTRVIVRNPKNHERYSIEFVVVRETFTPLIGARAAQQMKLININNSNFITASPTRPSQPEVHQLTSTEKICSGIRR
ncbi:unnamed protein product [Pocillopora meandrina]|uniref:Uncharacterized protein n=1 Tax=Pocillopora meandrina TaxID=46732 RepID=A0AAU9Y1W9_9CNID|nr:unnamed protein product [Pocillopora meandrina]